MKIFAVCLGMISGIGLLQAQDDQSWKGRFEQLGTTLPTPNDYRTGSGAPGKNYWQQKADYLIDVEIDDNTQILTGSETITYYNNSPDVLRYLWLQVDQNVRAKDNLADQTNTSEMRDSLSGKSFAKRFAQIDYEGGYKIKSIKSINGDDLVYFINRTMMRVDLKSPLEPGSQVKFQINWEYKIYDRMLFPEARGGYEYFPEDDNYAYTCAQWFPRMAVYDDVNGWQNKQFIGEGEFYLTFGDYTVNITVPSDHIVAATGELQNADKVLTKTQRERFEQAKNTYDKPIIIVSQEEVETKEKIKSSTKSTWTFKAKNVRDFAFASSRKYIWDAQAVQLATTTPLAMSFYPKEGNPLWEKVSTQAIKNTLEVYSERTIDYPYPVAISVNAAEQGMEYPMICFNFGRVDKNGRYSKRLSEATIDVIVHEIGHNYFPMIINTDERQWAWMDEGMDTFLEKETHRLRYPESSYAKWGTPKSVIHYMKGDKSSIRPIMVNAEQMTQAAYNAYGKPSAALTVLREVVMGPELFDRAFKEYAQRWAFKQPQPADFFRTMEDASAVDLDWFWKGWFYTTEHVDVELANVKWYRLKNKSENIENKSKKVIKGDLTSESLERNNSTDFNNGFEEISILDTPARFYGEFQNSIDDNAIRARLANKNIYELEFKNLGGLVTPIVIEFTFKDGTSERQVIPAEIWRKNEYEVSKVFVLEKEVTNIVIDPDEITCDVEVTNNYFPKIEKESRFDKFKSE